MSRRTPSPPGSLISLSDLVFFRTASESPYGRDSARDYASRSRMTNHPALLRALPPPVQGGRCSILAETWPGHMDGSNLNEEGRRSGPSHLMPGERLLFSLHQTPEAPTDAAPRTTEQGAPLHRPRSIRGEVVFRLAADRLGPALPIDIRSRLGISRGISISLVQRR